MFVCVSFSKDKRTNQGNQDKETGMEKVQSENNIRTSEKKTQQTNNKQYHAESMDFCLLRLLCIV
jgi:hypothetical protein